MTNKIKNYIYRKHLSRINTIKYLYNSEDLNNIHKRKKSLRVLNVGMHEKIKLCENRVQNK